MSKKRSAGSAKLQPGSASDPAPFGKYYLLGLIARGGMAEVYHARLMQPEGPPRLLAIKVMRPQLAREARFVDMFNREGQLAMLLRDECIVETVEVGRIDGRHYIAMEYIGGRDLTQLLRRCQETNKRIPVPHAVFIGAGIARGLGIAHALKGSDGRPLSIVNRDVSPSNVRVSYDGNVKLLDFGIAQALMKFTSEIGVLKGKFSYMSPEQIRGMPLDHRTDLFSTGIILHEMLTTEKLFRGDTEFALMEKVRKADIPPPSKFNRRVNPELDAIVAKCLARDVRDRHQSAGELEQDLNSLLEGYSFDPKELRQFIRSMFRKEYAKELADREESMTSLPLGEQPPEPATAPAKTSSATASSATAKAAKASAPTPAPTAKQTSKTSGSPSSAKGAGIVGSHPPEEKRGFWSKLGFGRKR